MAVALIAMAARMMLPKEKTCFCHCQLIVAICKFSTQVSWCLSHWCYCPMAVTASFLPLPVDCCCFSALVATYWLLPPTIAIAVTADCAVNPHTMLFLSQPVLLLLFMTTHTTSASANTCCCFVSPVDCGTFVTVTCCFCLCHCCHGQLVDPFSDCCQFYNGCG